jgi:hypothetical protein
MPRTKGLFLWYLCQIEGQGTAATLFFYNLDRYDLNKGTHFSKIHKNTKFLYCAMKWFYFLFDYKISHDGHVVPFHHNQRHQYAGPSTFSVSGLKVLRLFFFGGRNLRAIPPAVDLYSSNLCRTESRIILRLLWFI